MAKYTEQEIKEALASGKKPEGMSSTYWSKLRRGQAGKRYGIAEQSAVPEAPAPVAEAPVDSVEEASASDDEVSTTVVEADGTVKILNFSEV